MPNRFQMLAAASLIVLTGCISVTANEAPSVAAQTEKAGVNLILLYNLKPGVAQADFEAWVRNQDQPTMRGLKSVSDFRTYRSTGLMMGDGKPSAQYIETFAINDMAAFGSTDMASAEVQKIVGSFMGFADAPQFILVDEVK
jgi:hypothetical protein